MPGEPETRAREARSTRASVDESTTTPSRAFLMSQREGWDQADRWSSLPGVKVGVDIDGYNLYYGGRGLLLTASLGEDDRVDVA